MAASHPLIVDINLVQEKINTVLSQVAEESFKIELVLNTLKDIQRLLTTLSDYFSSKEQDASIKELLQQHAELIKSIVKRLEEGDKKITDDYGLLKEKVDSLEERVTQLEADRRTLMVCQLAFIIQEAVMNRVLLGRRRGIYTIKQLEKAVENKGRYAIRDPTEREAARVRWEELKVKLNWTYEHSCYIDELKGQRLPKAHPEFDPAVAKKDVESGIVDVLDKEMFMECLKMWEIMKPPDAQ